MSSIKHRRLTTAAQATAEAATTTSLFRVAKSAPPGGGGYSLNGSDGSSINACDTVSEPGANSPISADYVMINTTDEGSLLDSLPNGVCAHANLGNQLSKHRAVRLQPGPDDYVYWMSVSPIN